MKTACPVRKEAGGQALCEREVPRRRPALPSGRRIWPARLRHWLARSRRRQIRWRIAENDVFSRADDLPTHCKARRAFYLTPQVLQDRHIAGPSRQPQAHVSRQDRSIASTQASHTTARLRRQPGLCDQFRPRSCARVRIGAQACAGRTPPCTNVNTPPPSVHAFRTTSPANINGIAGPGAFYFPRAHSVGAGRRRRPGRIISVIRNAAELHRAQAPFPYYSTLYGIKSALPGRQHERGIPLSNSPHCRGPAPHTPRQRFAAAPRPAPGAGPVDTPRWHPQDQIANIATQTHATPHYSTLHKATRTRAELQTQTPGTDNRRGHTESTRITSTPANPGGPSRLVPHTLGASAYHSQTTLAPRKSGPALCGSIPRTRRAGPTCLQGRPDATGAMHRPTPPNAKSHTEPLRATHRPAQVSNPPPAPPGDGQNAAPSSQASRPPNLTRTDQPGPRCRPTPDQTPTRTPAERLTARSSHARSPAYLRAALSLSISQFFLPRAPSACLSVKWVRTWLDSVMAGHVRCKQRVEEALEQCSMPN